MLTSPASWGEVERFVGFVSHPQFESVTFNISVPAGEAASLNLPQGITLQFATRGSLPSTGQSQLSLRSASGETLHTATIPDAGQTTKSAAYVFCNAGLVYLSPAPESVPKCSGR